MREDEDRGVERRVGTPCALPLRVLVPSGVAELPGTHDLGADPRIEQLREGVVDAAAAAGLPPPRGEQPLVQPIAGVTEMGVGALTLTGAETVERWRSSGRGRVTWPVLLRDRGRSVVVAAGARADAGDVGPVDVD